jgi:hypothetical protein
MEAPGSLGSPREQTWSKVTSGMVLGDQEAPDRWVGMLLLGQNTGAQSGGGAGELRVL